MVAAPVVPADLLLGVVAAGRVIVGCVAGVGLPRRSTGRSLSSSLCELGEVVAGGELFCPACGLALGWDEA